MNTELNRLNSEWVSVNALRELLKISTKGDIGKSTYDSALELGGEIYPELLGDEVSLIRRERQSGITKEYKQKAKLLSIREKKEILAIEILKTDIKEYESLIRLEGKKGNEQLVKRLGSLYKAKEELEPIKHSENQLIFRDAYNADRNLPELSMGKGTKTFHLPNNNDIKIRVLHPDKPEHITGADLIYEYHNRETDRVNLVFIQYKIWEKRKLSISDNRLKKQLERLKLFTCSKGLCECNPQEKEEENSYRFPFCTSFLRPTDALQTADQKLISTGEHLPICRIDKVKSLGPKGGEHLDYKTIRDVSLSSIHFEELFNTGKIGSKSMSISELSDFYKNSKIIDSDETVVIYAREYS